MSSINTTVARERVGGELSKGELRFCNQLREYLQAAIEGRIPFALAMTNVSTDLREIRRWLYDVDGAMDSGWHPVTSIAVVPRTDAAPRTLPADLELAFLKDMDGLLDYAIRNGIDFSFFCSALGHDVSALREYEWSLEKVRSEGGIVPKVTGWAQRNVAAVGDSEPETE